MGLEPVATTWLTPERARLPPDDGEAVPPAVDGPVRQMVGALDQPPMLAEDLPLGGVTPQACLRHDDKAAGVDPEADGAVGEGCAGTVAPVAPRKPAARNAAAVALEGDQAPSRRLPAIACRATGGRHPLALLDEAVEGRRQRHQRCPLRGPGIRDAARQRAMPGLSPELDAALFQPAVHRRQVGELPIVAPLVRAQWAAAPAGGSGGGRPARSSRPVRSPSPAALGPVAQPLATA